MAATAVVKARFSFRFSSQSLKSKKKFPGIVKIIRSSWKEIDQPEHENKKKERKNHLHQTSQFVATFLHPVEESQ